MKITNQNKNIFLGNGLFGKQETDIRGKVAAKKQLYQKEAMHVVTSARKGEQKIDDNINTIKDRIRMLQDENDEANKFLQDINARMAQAKEDYNVADDSQEEQDLKLLQKAYDAKKPGAKTELTEEEKERLSAMGEPTEYQQLSMDLYGQADYWKEKMAENQLKIAGETSVIRNVKIERLKSQAMLNAEKAKEDLLEAASKEAMSMLIEDTKEQIDEKAEEIQEAAEEKAEKEEEQEERIEAVKENQTEAEAAIERNRENAGNLTEQAVESEDITQDIDSEIQKFLEEEKMLEEELKGLLVDTEI